jgi:hypothetical protein
MHKIIKFPQKTPKPPEYPYKGPELTPDFGSVKKKKAPDGVPGA